MEESARAAEVNTMTNFLHVKDEHQRRCNNNKCINWNVDFIALRVTIYTTEKDSHVSDKCERIKMCL